MRRKDPTSDPSTEVDLSEGHASSSTILIVVLVAAVLIGAYLFLAHSHSDALRVTRIEGVVTLQKGLYAPWGWGNYAPSTALEPLSIDADIAVREGACADLGDCEARIFEAVLEQARRALRQPERRAEAMALLHRASRLAPESAQGVLRSLQDEGQYHKGLMSLDAARASLIEARRHFFAVRGADPDTVERAADWMKLIDGLIDDLDGKRVRSERGPRTFPTPEREAMPARRPPQAPTQAPKSDAGIDMSDVEAESLVPF